MYENTRAEFEWLKNAVATRDRSDCWEWPFKSTTSGYARMSTRKASHIALELDGRQRPKAPGDFALHSCDNRLCVNPSHLRWGTQEDNVGDAVSRGRHKMPGLKGSAKNQSSLIESDVVTIRNVADRKTRTQTQLAEEYGVGIATISRIVNRKMWKHVEESEKIV